MGEREKTLKVVKTCTALLRAPTVVVPVRGPWGHWKSPYISSSDREAQTACHGVGQKLKLLVDETVRHIFVFYGFTFSGKVKCHFKC